jgi:hypothetical protein
MLYYLMILTNHCTMQVSGVEKAKGKHSKLNLYLKQWVLSLLLCLLESSNLREQVKKQPFFS